MSFITSLFSQQLPTEVENLSALNLSEDKKNVNEEQSTQVYNDENKEELPSTLAELCSANESKDKDMKHEDNNCEDNNCDLDCDDDEPHLRGSSPESSCKSTSYILLRNDILICSSLTQDKLMSMRDNIIRQIRMEYTNLRSSSCTIRVATIIDSEYYNDNEVKTKSRKNVYVINNDWIISYENLIDTFEIKAVPLL
jgi:hypothetical protein